MAFDDEKKFEDALVEILFTKDWEREVLNYPSEDDLLENWKKILYDNNRDIDHLGDFPLTNGEMEQILEQIRTLKTPVKLNGFINGKTVLIKRDNPDDVAHLGREIALKIYDRQEIAKGKSRYQIARQPRYKGHHDYPPRRGDLVLLINGMPVIHIELKKSGIAVTEATNQIQKYMHEGVFSGLFSLVQVFVAMTPEETLYFANPGPDGVFNKNNFFHWADANNKPINDWREIAEHLISIPMAHMLIGFYTVPDSSDGVLKVMRSYQYYAASRIEDRVSKVKWADKDIYGGFIWHTTGSGKTLTSFKSAHLIADAGLADKVVFLMDRVELGTQSLDEYRHFMPDDMDVQDTDSTDVLVAKLKSNDPANRLIVTSLQKMSRIHEDDKSLSAAIAKIRKKHVVVIVDECHRSTFGEMLATVKKTLPSALFFGFTGTPIFEENQKKGNTTADVFGSELHRYLISDGIEDRNVLPFDPVKVLTYKDVDLRRCVALEQAHAATEEEALADEKKAKVYLKFMQDVGMGGDRGLESYLPEAQYDRDEHRNAVVDDICDHWTVISRNGKFHGILTTASIPEAVEYYKLFKKTKPSLKVAAVFDSSCDGAWGIQKEDAIIEMLDDYNARYGMTFGLSSYEGAYRKDVARRLAHKEPYLGIEKKPVMQLDLVIVVNQMLTGYDSKWVNALFVDRNLENEHLIQAFSRTNRTLGPNKPFGNIRYYRRPHTMEQQIKDAFALYSGERPYCMFVGKLKANLERLNRIFDNIRSLFVNAGLSDFSKLPEEEPVRAQFARDFRDLVECIETVKIQGFTWDKNEYGPDVLKEMGKVVVGITQEDYIALRERYREMSSGTRTAGGAGLAYDVDAYVTEIGTDKIDADYLNSRFKKYMLSLGGKNEASVLDELHQSFAILTQEDQRYAKQILVDVQNGVLKVDDGKTLSEYIGEYKTKAKNDTIHKCAQVLGLDESKLREMVEQVVSPVDIDAYGRFEALKATVDFVKAKAYFEEKTGSSFSVFKVNMAIDEFLREFILKGGMPIREPHGSVSDKGDILQPLEVVSYPMAADPSVKPH